MTLLLLLTTSVGIPFLSIDWLPNRDLGQALQTLQHFDPFEINSFEKPNGTVVTDPGKGGHERVFPGRHGLPEAFLATVPQPTPLVLMTQTIVLISKSEILLVKWRHIGCPAAQVMKYSNCLPFV
jgi:hypothetical protein